MALTRLKNIITSRTGRIIYVNPDDFDASDAYDNNAISLHYGSAIEYRPIVDKDHLSLFGSVKNQIYRIDHKPLLCDKVPIHALTDAVY